MIYRIIVFLVLSISISITAQQFTIKGKVTDAVSQIPLSFANLRVANSTSGTASNVNGDFEIKLQPGKYLIIASFIGYNSDTIEVKLNNQNEFVNFKLKQTDITLDDIIVKPGENPALAIIRKAIEKRKIRNKKINCYEVESYTKGVIRTPEEISSQDRSINIDLGTNDSLELKITGLLENHAKTYFVQPDKRKDIIIARKQSANFPPGINTLTGGRLIQNFYDEEINFFGSDIPGPLSDDALEYYYFRIDKVVAQNNKKIFQIHVETDDPVDPGFEGKLFITDSTFDLIKVDVMINRAANTGGFLDTINVYQQFDEYDEIFMPVDYRLFIKASYLGLINIGFELNTILFNYAINKELSDDVFSKAIVTVLPEADKIDSTYWQRTQIIPNTFEEELAYKRIDSLEQVPKTFWDNFSFLSNRISINDSISVSAPLAMYHFSRVEGNALDFGFFINDFYNRRLNSSLSFSYGFSDKKFKQDFSANYLLGKYRTWKTNLKIFNKTKILFEESDPYGELFSTLIAILSKDEFRDYYYSNGFELGVEGEVLPVLKLSLAFGNKTDKNAYNTSDFSIFNKDKSYRPNPAIYETKINSLRFGFNIDFRDYIEDGYFRRRTSLGKSYILFSGSVTYSNSTLAESKLNFTNYEFITTAYLKTFKSAYLDARLFLRYNDGATPYQDLYSLPGNIDVVFKSPSFRTINPNEIIGDKVATLNLTHSFQDEIFKALNVPGFKNWEIMISLIFNAAIVDITQESESILVNPVKLFKSPFYEIGFSVGQALFPFDLEFMWKLNHKDGKNFRIGLNMPLL